MTLVKKNRYIREIFIFNKGVIQTNILVSLDYANIHYKKLSSNVTHKRLQNKPFNEHSFKEAKL